MSNHNPELTVFQRTMLQLLWILCRGFALLPHFVRHNIFGSLCYWVLCYVLRYRHRVIMDNLRRSFPVYSEQQLNTICRDTYKNLAEQIINTISQSGISDEELRRRMTFSNDGPTREAVGGRSAVFMTAHYGPWEAGSVVSLAFPDQTFVAVYHKITNPIVDELMKRIRRHTNVELVDMKRTMRHFIDNRQRRPMIMGLIADQNPTLRPNMSWYPFLNQWTAFFDGGEVLARKYNLPVYYFSPRRLRAGYYEGTFTLIHDGESPIEPGEITRRYAKMLEAEIVANPAMWMWSHRRWKHTPPAELQATKI